jgi:DNA polymerase-3 subunit alpha
MFQVACGYTEEEADEIREIVGKKQADKMKALVPEISRKLEQGGWTEIQIESFISLCNAAAGYSFNKSHAVSYAYLGFACQYLKENFPLEWWASVLQNSKKEDLRANSQYCAKFISAPDVNLSEVDVFIADKRGRSNLGRIVFPLRMLHGVGTSASCIAETKPYSSLTDFYERIDRRKVNRGVVARLIWSGAFDSLCGVQKISQRNQVYSKYLKLYGGPEKDTFVPKTELELMKAQGEAFPVIEPDYASYAVKATGRPISCASVVGRGSTGRRIKVAGIVRDIHKLQTKKGDDMAFITIANLDASASITLFPEAYQTYIDIIKEGEVVIVMGQVNEFNSRRSLIADEIKLVE